MRSSMRVSHRYDHRNTHVAATRSPQMRLYRQSQVNIPVYFCSVVAIRTVDTNFCSITIIRIRSCTCYGAPEGDPGVLFEGTPHCEAVHGALHACLRALFGVSVAGILACIFSCMLVYQLLSHEKKKMYWEQLELRCRSLYGQGGTVGPATGSCGCCNDCGGASPWWAQTPGNLYTPNPDLAPSRFVRSKNYT